MGFVSEDSDKYPAIEQHNYEKSLSPRSDIVLKVPQETQEALEKRLLTHLQNELVYLQNYGLQENNADNRDPKDFDDLQNQMFASF